MTPYPFQLQSYAKEPMLNRDYQESIGFPAPPAQFLIGFRCVL